LDAVSASTTAARFSADGSAASGSRAKAAQASAIFRLVASSKALMMLDYTRTASDETKRKIRAQGSTGR
jgi:hypothetical protein